ncbi:MAG TPA: polysaccharide deacetylase family protein [Firmicutes bacterium]|nr:polysaccharide deacetylase family protein [Bacillota bacterium]
MRRRGFSFIITKRGLFFIVSLLVAISAATWGVRLARHGRRYLNGVKAGVCLEGYNVERLLEPELYDVVADIAQSFAVEARNAKWDWETNSLQEEVVGQVADVAATVQALLEAPANTRLKLVAVPVLPSITAAHFQPYYQGPGLEPKVALMINIDWGEEFILGMLEVLAARGVLATWFPTGRWAEKEPELAEKIAAAGHEIGNHGGWHGLAGKMSRSEVTRLIQEGEDKIMAATGQKPQIFAPPAGDFNKQTVAAAAELGYKTVLWTVDTVDWQRPQPTVIIDRVLSGVTNGALILMHPTKPTLEALPIILEHLENRGYVCVTVSELLAD